MLAAYGFCPLEPESDEQSHEPFHSPTSSVSIDSPQPAINKPGFIDNDDGSNIRTGPAELDGQALTAQPLPPATRVFVSGQHPEAPTWWYVSAHLPEAIVRGYVQNFRVNTDLPEPSAKLYQIKSGDTARALARREFSASVRDGHDLRYYENVLLAVNRNKNRAGIKGTFQDPGMFGGGDNNIQLEAGRRIWLVSSAYARSLEGMVPDGSLTNGGYAKVKRVLGHIDDLVQSVTDSPQYFGTVAGEYAEAIKDHLPEIIGITAGFILAESASAFLAATPTGVGQLAAVVIQLGLAAFGASFAIDAGIEALKHGEQWLTLAWTAKGDPSMLTKASKEFLKMLVSIATAALAILGVRGNVGKGLKIADAIKIQPPKVGWSPAMVTPEGVVVPGGPVFTPGSIATTGPVDIGISAMTGVGSSGSKIKPGESKANTKTGEEGSSKTGDKNKKVAKGEVTELSASLRSGDVKLPDSVLFRTGRMDAKGRPFGSPSNPNPPPVSVFNPRIYEMAAGDIKIGATLHPTNKMQGGSVSQLSNAELVHFRLSDPISSKGLSGGSLNVTGGHHRLAEIQQRVAAGTLPPDTRVRILLHD
ncbi:MAG: hypothetical protein MJE77_25915 [Proteobacteria bacterium]|nr:hypothetical protein [Pseudomonadota bacterium]